MVVYGLLYRQQDGTGDVFVGMIGLLFTVCCGNCTEQA